MHFKEGIEIYNRHLLKIIACTITFFLPMHLFILGWILILQQTIRPELINFHFLFLYILMYVSMIPPYMKIANRDLLDEEVDFKELWKTVLGQFGFLLIASISFMLISFIGASLFYIPVLLALGLMVLLPLHYEDSKSIGEIIKNTWVSYKTNFIDLFLFLLFVIAANVLIWFLLTAGVSYFETNLLGYTVLRMLIHLIVFPYFIILLTINFHPDYQNTRGQKFYTKGLKG
ncbi:hypothetical protein [Peribacillus alkalitolerans]|uniref:hypothetical protein n=1 Tax=Peribacillus alkalitolerans TaxID=1550385 RepID=UPI0013D7FFD9|nr:hypothetical protein [Peribacillus alkalitolerans]